MGPLAFPVRGRKAVDLVALGCTMTRGRVKTFALYIQCDGRPLPSQQVRCHDQRMGKDLRGDVAGARLWAAQFAQCKPGSRLSKEPVGFHLAALLPMGLPKSCEGRAGHGKAHHQPGDGSTADDQIDQLEIIRPSVPDPEVVLCDISKIDIGAEPEGLKGQHSRGNGVAHRTHHQSDQNYPDSNPSLAHRSTQWMWPRSVSPSTSAARCLSTSTSANSSTT